MLVDSHAHVNFPELMADIDGVLARAKAAGVEKIINVGTSLEDSQKAIELAQKHEGRERNSGDPDSPIIRSCRALRPVDRTMEGEAAGEIGELLAQDQAASMQT